MTNSQPKRVALLMGGWSAEREVSLSSGAGIAKALTEMGHDVKVIDVKRDARGLLDALTPLPDVVFNALHGRGGEDGCVQGVLEFLGVPYTHSGVLASAVAMDKPMTKRILSGVGVRCADGVVATREQVLAGHVMPPPYVVKPPNDGSSVGVYIVRNDADHAEMKKNAANLGLESLVEKYIAGRELTVGVMGGKALAVTEIKSTTDFYDYIAKYSAGGSSHVLPAPIPPEVEAEAKRFSELAYHTLGCNGLVRVDFRYDDGQSGTSGLYFLEVNTQPGFTPTSLAPEQAAYVGMSFKDIVAWMLENPTCPG